LRSPSGRRPSGGKPPAAPTGKPRALILVPTRELANQVMLSLKPLAAAMSLRVATVYGGVGQGPQVAALRNGVDIVVACPGRLEDLIGQRHCRLDAVEITVLDEADHMADLGFLPGVKRLLDATPVGGQRLLFSATLDKAVDALVRQYLVNPIVHSVDPEVSSVDTMTHHVLAIRSGDKAAVVSTLAGGLDRTLLFMRTKHGAKKMASSCARRAFPQSSCTATCRRAPVNATSPTSPAVESACSSPPTSPHVAFTSTTSRWSYTSIRRQNTRRSCTARVAPPGPAQKASSSR
jgi:superfamily II DNA/RNA helicase